LTDGEAISPAARVDLVQQRWTQGAGWNADRSLVYAEGRLQAMADTNLTVSYQVERTQHFLSVQNLVDKQPTPGLFGGFVPGEDTIGRYFTVGLRYRR
jgi:hypothetical protein